ncbi:hypothetical protein TSUD_137320 [Trifolium subterraneum]|uniref:Uncharacterized protein n=1 Tax=Trifolium subterraneum TaxID=3900 RepID=A0A2Z6P6T0_TRISU|nr:hypothetical protein TSUD_137320 [Trifolium subterraneum]
MPEMRISNQLREPVLVEVGCIVCSTEVQHLDPAHLVVFVDGRLMEAIQPPMRMRLLANKIHQLGGRGSSKQMFACLWVIMVSLLFSTVLQREKCGIWWVTVKMLVSLLVEVRTAQ